MSISLHSSIVVGKGRKEERVEERREKKGEGRKGKRKEWASFFVSLA
jgi:hypothetical protein